jgi:hypothetical protein
MLPPTDTMERHAELERRGWVRVTDISTRPALLELARSLGSPVPSPTGELVKEIRITPASNARTGTLSAAYGDGEFPLHTDTAFWPVPARYIVLRVRGDTRRPTTISSFEDLSQECGGHSLLVLAEKSIWRVRTRSASFYCSLRFRVNRSSGWRYDRECMFPANGAAQKLEQILESLTTGSRGESIGWSGDEAIVLSNWSILHGRGRAPRDEKERILDRVYVR